MCVRALSLSQRGARRSGSQSIWRRLSPSHHVAGNFVCSWFACEECSHVEPRGRWQGFNGSRLAYAGLGLAPAKRRLPTQLDSVFPPPPSTLHSTWLRLHSKWLPRYHYHDCVLCRSHSLMRTSSSCFSEMSYALEAFTDYCARATMQHPGKTPPRSRPTQAKPTVS